MSAVPVSWPSPAATSAVAALAATPRLLVALDFDGTCAPLVDEPMAARALPAVAAAVERLADLPATTVAYVSGRSMRDLRIIAAHPEDSRVLLSGSHGAEFWFPGEGVRAGDADQAVRDGLTEAARAQVADLAGVMIEPKAFGFAVHTRRAAAGAQEQAFDRVGALMDRAASDWRRRRGHDVLEFSSSDAGKDVALGLLRDRAAATGVLFAGDDVTDEDALRTLADGDLGVRVGVGETAASLRVPDPAGLADLLTALRAERSRERE